MKSATNSSVALPAIPMGIQPIVICVKCGKVMDIKKWMWARSRYPEAPERLFIPCFNRGHPCQNCGHYWLSTDVLEPMFNYWILVWRFWG